MKCLPYFLADFFSYFKISSDSIVIAGLSTQELTHSTVDKNFSRRHLEYFSFFSQKTGFDISCKLSPLETICMKCQILFPGKNKKNVP